MSALTNRYEDDDASHLPPGMKRVGYDADTERYTFREGDDLWLGEPGSFYGGQLKWAGKVSQADGDDGEEDETDGSSTGHAGGSDQGNTSMKSLREHAQKATQDGKGSPRSVADNPWGVPVVSISATGAKPPDSPKDDKSVQTHARKVRRAATLTANALGIINRRPGKDANTA